MRRLAKLIIAALVPAIAANAPAQAQSLDEVWRDKSVKILVPTTPGGDRAPDTLPVAQVLDRHLPGMPSVVPAFMPGAGDALAIDCQ